MKNIKSILSKLCAAIIGLACFKFCQQLGRLKSSDSVSQNHELVASTLEPNLELTRVTIAGIELLLPASLSEPTEDDFDTDERFKGQYHHKKRFSDSSFYISVVIRRIDFIDEVRYSAEQANDLLLNYYKNESGGYGFKRTKLPMNKGRAELIESQFLIQGRKVLSSTIAISNNSELWEVTLLGIGDEGVARYENYKANVVNSIRIQ